MEVENLLLAIIKYLLALFIYIANTERGANGYPWYNGPVPGRAIMTRNHFDPPTYRLFFNGINLSAFFFNRLKRRGVFLPRVDISDEYDLSPNLVAYDPTFIDFKPPPNIPASDGYKTQFVCDYDYDPMTDPGDLYHEYCFYYVYTPKSEKNSYKDSYLYDEVF